DEGGAITTGMVPGVKGKSAMVAVHEKSRHMYRCVASRSVKGHGGLNPSSDSAISRLTAFIQEVEKSHIYRSSFAPEVKETFVAHAPYMSFPYNMLFGNLGVFGPVVKPIMQRIPQAKAMLSTSISFTTIFGGTHEDPQIQAKEAETTMFLRCVREDDLLAGLEKIKAID
ncbi:carboxypeptidase PM20D1, partial [gut metagenome]